MVEEEIIEFIEKLGDYLNLITKGFKNLRKDRFIKKIWKEHLSNYNADKKDMVLTLDHINKSSIWELNSNYESFHSLFYKELNNQNK
jgi:hypothetical protein